MVQVCPGKIKSNLTDLVNRSSRQPACCILCGCATHDRGVWIPADPAAEGFGRPAPGKVRGIAYAICERHDTGRQEVMAQIEQAIRVEVAVDKT